VLVAAGVRVEGLGAVDGDGGELGVQFFEHGFREASPDVADGFVGVGFGTVAGEQEGAVDGCAFASAIVSAEDDEVETVAYAGEVVFLDLF
jgi:hypothetical protein